MTSYAMANTNDEKGSVDKALRWVGDLDHPFYSDERNRYVWYEASAIAFQLLFLSSYFVAGLVLWIGGSAALPYTLAMFAPTMVTAVVFQTYLKRNSAEYWPGKNDLFRRRGQLAIVAGVFLLTGLIRASTELGGDGAGGLDSFLGGISGGMIAGLLVGPLAAVAVIVYRGRQQAKLDDADEL